MTAAVLRALGEVNRQAGDLTQAQEQLEESLRIMRVAHADRDHPMTAAVLRALGEVNRQAGDLTQQAQK